MPFCEDFVWGAASSALQIEGYSTADGGGETVWDAFCRREGAVALGDTTEIACDSYHRFTEDIQQIAAMGLRHYRFSTNWARIDPKGDGQWNPAGLAYYDRLIDACLAAGIRPWVTLHHWELPQALQEKGGWLNRETAEAFARFAGMMAEHFRGRISDYITFNEPEIVIGFGYGSGLHAPGLHCSMPELFTGWKHMMLAHGLAGRAIRKADPAARIGIVSAGRNCWPAKESDRECAREEMFALRDDDWIFTHNFVFDPVCFGELRTTPGTELHALAQTVTAEEWNMMHFEPDFIGLNLYNGNEIYAGEDGQPRYTPKYAGFPRTALKWPVTPQIMNDSIVFVYERYRKPVYITECGLSCSDWVHLDGCVHDPERIDFLHRYLSALKDGAEKADIRGFFYWSLLDNFEWHSGYTERFGLVYVDYPTLRRIPKDSASWYAQTAADNGQGL